MTKPLPTVDVYQGGRRILASGAACVGRQSPPLVVVCEGEVLTIHAELDQPFKQSDGTILGGRYHEHGIAPDETKTVPLGGAHVTYALHPFRQGEIAPDFAGRFAPTAWLLLWEVWSEAPGMAVPAVPVPSQARPSRDPSDLVSYGDAR